MHEDLYVLEMDDMQQSAVDLVDPSRLVFDYMRRVGDVIDRLPPGPVRIVHVGGAAMTLPRYVHATRPRSSQIVLEPSIEVIDRVRSEAPLPPRSGIKVRPVDGKAGIGGVRDGFADMVILDAFAGGRTPDELVTAAFVEDVRRVLAPSGVFVANLVDRAPFAQVRDFVAAARDLGDVVLGVEPATLKGRRPGNLVVVCGAVPESPLGAPSPMEYRIFTGRAVADSFGGGTAR
ncbi:spermidine synthase [Nocardioides sp. KC13]|uniref:Spermidine synthase n=1 Tax=Nocardioides turkmenicus TaxID=2711220 RepID=A0A6M1R8H6_9ACTN|nr:fused MFS/spermidine synthase [Nocardioides sp. KC13]NGN93878.1 spermidine synthase [Nocardioides sp. KC13]